MQDKTKKKVKKKTQHIISYFKTRGIMLLFPVVIFSFGPVFVMNETVI